MAQNKNFNSIPYKRIIDLAKLETAGIDDLVRVWNVESGSEKVISLENLVNGNITPVTIGTPANGLSIDSNQVLTIGLASTSTTGALSSTDWNTFNNKQPAGSYVTTARTITINGLTQDLSANRTWSVGTVTSVGLTVPTGLTVAGSPITSSGVLAISLQSGYSIPTTAKQTQWDTAYTNRITNLTTTGNSGASTLISNVLNIPNYTLAGLGGIGGTIASGQVAFGTGVNTIGGDTQLIFDSVTNRLAIGTTLAPSSTIYLGNTFNSNFISLRSDAINATGFYGLGAYNSGLNFGVGIWVGTGASLPTAIDPSFFINAPGGISANTRIGILTTAPTNTLDVNGTTRIRTIANGVGNFITTSATGVLQQRTASEALTDIGAIGGTIASGQVAFGTGANVIGGSANFQWNNSLSRLEFGGVGATIKGLNSALIIASDVTSGNRILLRPDGDASSTNQLIIDKGILTFTGTQIIQTSTGNLNFTTGTGNGNILLTPSGTGSVGINATPTSKLDINGDLRVRTIANGVGNFITTSATGVLQQRTASEVRTDIGGIGGTIASGQVAFGTGVNVIGGDSGLTWDNVNKRLLIGVSQPIKFSLTSTLTAGNNYFDFTNNTGVQGQIGFLGGSSDNLSIINVKDANIIFATNNTIRWNILGSNGTLISTGPQTIQTSTGDLTLATGAGNGNIVLSPNGTGLVGINTTSPTNTLDVNGTTRIRTINNLGTTPTEVLVPSATGVISKRTLTEFISDGGFVTLTGAQTITGAKIFSNSLLELSGSNAILRIKTTDNTSNLFFRNVVNEDAASIVYNDPSKLLTIGTNVSNADISISPNGTGSIILPNVASGTGDVLMLNGSNKIVKGSAGSGLPDAPSDGSFYGRLNGGWVKSNEQGFTSVSSGTVSLIDSNSNVTYSTTTATINKYYHKILKLSKYHIVIVGLSSSGSPSGGNVYIRVNGDSTFLNLDLDNSKSLFNKFHFTGTSLSDSQISLLTPVITNYSGVKGIGFKLLNATSDLSPFTASSGRITLTIHCFE